MKKYQNHFYLIFILYFIITCIPNYSIAQKKESVDNGYYITYPDKLMLRLYFSQKFAPFTISSKNSYELNYKTNSKLNLGVGATYHSFTLNLSYGFNFLNPDKGQGKTKGLDLQFHVYPKKWAIDILGTFLNGYYLDPKDNNGLNLTTYYQRQDIKRDVLGFSIFRVPNSDKFSYKAAVVQSEWQTKSAGSLLYGGEVYHGEMKGDSALVPNKVSNSFEQAGINKINFVSVGPGAGYAYTLVIDKKFFVTGSAIINVDLNISSEEKASGKQTKTKIIPSGVYKGAMGYNSSKWSVSANIIGNALYAASAYTSKNYFAPTGNFRFIVAKKIGIRKH